MHVGVVCEWHCRMGGIAIVSESIGRPKLTPAPYEKTQTSEEMMYMQAVRSSWQLSTEVLHAHECVVSE